MRKTIVYTPGVWDLFHVGHLNFLKEASFKADKLYVGVCGDKLAKKTKGYLPVMNEQERLPIALCLCWTYYAEIYNDANHSEILKRIGADVFAVGSEYGQYDYQKKTLAYCKENNIEVKVIPRTEGISTSTIKERILK